MRSLQLLPLPLHGAPKSISLYCFVLNNPEIKRLLHDFILIPIINNDYLYSYYFMVSMQTPTGPGDRPLAEIRLNRVTIHANPLAG